MFRPVGESMIVEVWRDVSSKVITPDNKEPSKSDIFVVKALGRGTLLDDGRYVRPDIEIGDKVCLVGKLWTIKAPDGEFTVASMMNVIAHERDIPYCPTLREKPNDEAIEIPNRI